ncbi:peptidase M24, structural domain-containing protein [Cunninghamella echinulata]|nr:peptidase M24, structural domain-containing protein [Cunninghamella echinulata]
MYTFKINQWKKILIRQQWRRITQMAQQDKLENLRKAMATALPKPVDVFIVPSEDAHQSEYTAECDNRRAWISGFTGSAGCAVITRSEAKLFTDGRYFLQASKELDPQQWELMKQGLPGIPTWQEYVKSFKNAKIGIDPTVITLDAANQLMKELSKKNSTLVPVKENLIDKIRGDERPSRPTQPIKIHDIQYAGKTHNTKIIDLLADINSKGCDGTIITSLDEIAWLLNLRGSDIHCCPVVFAYCVVTNDTTLLYVKNNTDQSRFSESLLEHLSLANVQVRDYDSILPDLGSMKNNGTKWFIDPQSTNLSITESLGDNISYGTSMIPLAKAIKNPTELASSKKCHERDGAAVCQHFAWLSHELDQHKTLREYDAAIHLENMRRQNPEYVGLSFDTIAATGPSGSIIHYQPSPTDSAIIDPYNIYLCDSGAQYIDGTTDITRTFLFQGTPSDFQKRAFTRVLQSHIALDQAVFPYKTTGYHLDAIGRQPLWQDGLDFRHGFGHGVGSYLNVHEGPQGIGRRPAYNDIPLEENMLVTNEPGFYKDGEFGIRIENVLCVKKVETPYQSEETFLGFDHLTFVPLGKRLLDIELLSDKEKKWINTYHQQCRHVLEPLLQNDRQTLIWLDNETKNI